jgi:hypothetical protein
MLFVIVDRFLKIARYIAYIIEITALNLIELLFKEIFFKFRALKSIVNDRGSLFISS